MVPWCLPRRVLHSPNPCIHSHPTPGLPVCGLLGVACWVGHWVRGHPLGANFLCSCCARWDSDLGAAMFGGGVTHGVTCVGWLLDSCSQLMQPLACTVFTCLVDRRVGQAPVPSGWLWGSCAVGCSLYCHCRMGSVQGKRRTCNVSFELVHLYLSVGRLSLCTYLALESVTIVLFSC